MDGVVLVDKPVGPTSQTVVSRVKRAVGADKAGHTGTLDPFATGLLVVCLGRATKIATWLTVDDKEYLATAVFGSATDTDDATGKEISAADASALTRDSVEAALEKFRGPIRQVPPAFSAIHVDGERSYDLARKGEAVALEPRDVIVHRLVLESFTAGARATAVMSIHVSKGTYIRAIARDLGAALGVGGHLSALRRTAAGGLRVDAAVALEELEKDRQKALAAVISLDRVPLPMQDLRVTPEETAKLAHGVVPSASVAADKRPDGLRAIRAPDGRLLAVALLSAGRLTLQRVI